MEISGSRRGAVGGCEAPRPDFSPSQVDPVASASTMRHARCGGARGEARTTRPRGAVKHEQQPCKETGSLARGELWRPPSHGQGRRGSWAAIHLRARAPARARSFAQSTGARVGRGVRPGRIASTRTRAGAAPGPSAGVAAGVQRRRRAGRAGPEASARHRRQWRRLRRRARRQRATRPVRRRGRPGECRPTSRHGARRASRLIDPQALMSALHAGSAGQAQPAADPPGQHIESRPSRTSTMDDRSARS